MPDRRPGADGRKEHDEDADDDCVRDEDAAVAEASEDRRQDCLEADGRHRLRHHEEARLDGGEAEPDLVEEWEEKWDSAEAEAREEAARDRHAEGSDPKESEVE